jgi:hypothetical protein
VYVDSMFAPSPNFLSAAASARGHEGLSLRTIAAARRLA